MMKAVTPKNKSSIATDITQFLWTVRNKQKQSSDDCNVLWSPFHAALRSSKYYGYIVSEGQGQSSADQVSGATLMHVCVCVCERESETVRMCVVRDSVRVFVQVCVRACVCTCELRNRCGMCRTAEHFREKHYDVIKQTKSRS